MELLLPSIWEMKESEYLTERCVKCWKHSQPQRGGKFELTMPYLDKYYFVIKNMTMAKYNSALMIVEIGKFINIAIQPQAVSNAMTDISL